VASFFERWLRKSENVGCMALVALRYPHNQVAVSSKWRIAAQGLTTQYSIQVGAVALAVASRQWQIAF
jgi:hypothetical protein